MKRYGLIIGCLFLVTGLLFLTKQHRCKALPWMQEQIQSDLSAFKKEDLSSEALQKVYEARAPEGLLIYYQIKNNKVYWKKNWESHEAIDRARKTTRMLNCMTKTRKLPDVEFVLTVHDGYNCESVADPALHHPDRAPIFCYAKTKDSPGILFPDPLSEGFSRRSRKSIAKANKRPKYAWDSKKEVAFWRGGTTGGSFEMNNWFDYPRSKLALLTKYYPNKIDTGFTTFPGVEANVKQEMLNNLPKVTWTVHKDHLQYKYLIVPDGNTCTYPRYYLSLFSNSVTFKQESDQIQWFYRALQPFVHYVPVAYDFSDLPEKVQWAQENDQKMLEISKNATQFVNQNLLPKHICDYVETLLNQYAQLQEGNFELLDGMSEFKDFKEEHS